MLCDVASLLLDDGDGIDLRLVVFIEYIDVCPCDEQTYRPVLFLYSEQLYSTVCACTLCQRFGYVNRHYNEFKRCETRSLPSIVASHANGSLTKVTHYFVFFFLILCCMLVNVPCSRTVGDAKDFVYYIDGNNIVHSARYISAHQLC